MRRKGLHAAAMAVLACLALCLMFLGKGYAAWKEPIHADLTMKTGAMDIVFDSSQPFTAQIYEGDGTTTLSDIYPVGCELSDDGTHAQLCIEQSLLVDELLQSNRLLVLRHPLRCGKDNAVKVAEIMADLSAAPEDTLICTPKQVSLNVGGTDVQLSDGAQSLPPLTFDVYRQIELSGEGTDITGTAYLRLREESAQAFLSSNFIVDAGQLPSEFFAFCVPSAEDPSTIELEGEIEAYYTLSLPLDLFQDYQAE